MPDYLARVRENKADGMTSGGLAHLEAKKHFIAWLEEKEPHIFEVPNWVSLRKKDFENKKPITVKQAVDWALDNVNFKDVDAKDAPSQLAWLYLDWMRIDDAFLKDILKRKVPNLAMKKTTERIVDDGREQFTLIDKLKTETQADNEDTVLPSVPQKLAV